MHWTQHLLQCERPADSAQCSYVRYTYIQHSLQYNPPGQNSRTGMVRTTDARHHWKWPALLYEPLYM